ncbi:MAG TPA: hypothetical protein PLB35_12315 [Myxococcota bacterium]|nr:hypothetical protein [Myxococcota bacterium]
MAIEERIPFGRNPEAQRRWNLLIEWWEYQTTYSIGRLSDSLSDWVLPPSITSIRAWPEGEDPISRWDGQSPELTKILCQRSVMFPASPLDDEWEWERIGENEIKRRYKLIECLKTAALEVLKIEFGVGGWSGRYWNEELKSMQSAIRVVSNFPNPYRAKVVTGDRNDQRIVRMRMRTAQDLSRLRLKDGRSMTEDEMTILYLLAVPDGVGPSIDTPVEWWNFQDDWVLDGVEDEEFDVDGMIAFSAGYIRFKRRLRSWLKKTLD